MGGVITVIRFTPPSANRTNGFFAAPDCFVRNLVTNSPVRFEAKKLASAQNQLTRISPVTQAGFLVLGGLRVAANVGVFSLAVG